MAKKRGKKRQTGSILPIAFFQKKAVLTGIACFILLLAFGFTVKHFMLNSKDFTIQKVVVNNVKGYTFDKDERIIQKRYLGRNIFTVDLKRAEILIKNDFPHFRRVEVRRILPDMLEVDVVSREPAAVIDVLGGVIIDDEGFVINVGETPEQLTKIRGVSFFFRSPAKGKTINNRNLGKALILMRGVDEMIPGIKGDIGYIDVSDKRNTLLSIRGVVIKMGPDNYLHKLEKLREIMQDPAMNINDMNYIDLRFEDVVISPK